MRTNEAIWIEKSKRWQIKVQKEGVRKTFNSSTIGKKGKIECEKKADNFLDNNILNTSIRFKKAYEKFLEEIKLLTSTPNFKKHKSIGLNHLLPTLEHKKVTSLISQDFQQCINNAYKKDLSKKTLANIRGTISKFVAFCKKSGYAINQIENIVIPKNAKVNEKKILQPDKLKLLFDDSLPCNQDEFYLQAYRFLVLTGLRRGELCALKKTDIKNKVVTVKKSINSLQELTNGKTKNSKRQFILCKKTEECIARQKEVLKKRNIISPYVFPNTKGDVSNTQLLFEHWKNYREKIGVKCSLHELRHTFISISQADIPEQLLKRVVGHSKKMDTFGIYGHSVDGDLERIANMVDSTFTRFL